MSNTVILKLKKFKIKSISNDSVIIFIGRRRTGKSIVVKDILRNNKSIPIGFVISATESANQFYGDFIPKLYIHNEYQKEVVEEILKRQRNILKLTF